MTISPLARGLITGATQIDDALVASAFADMLDSAPREELTQALMDMTGLVVVLSDRADVSMDDVLKVVTA